jgi:hypothetical protein
MIWQDYKKLYANALKQYSPKFKKELQKQVDVYCRTQDLNAIGYKGIEKTIKTLHVSLGTKMAQVSSKSLKSSIKSNYERLEVKSQQTDMFAYAILKILENDGVTTLAQDITETTRKQIDTYIRNGLEKGLPLNDIIKQLKTAGITDYRAELIARTETGRAANLGSQVGAISTGLKTNKEWIATKDARTRRQPRDQTDHLHMDGFKIPMEKQFEVKDYKTGFDLMDHPCDSKAPLAQVCNCRCTMGYEAVRDARGKLITYDKQPPLGRIGMIWGYLSNVVGMQIGNLIADLFE